ncbi:hypothetical protein [Singulisphaera acidiphila]|uniref:Uncharacterized protein n=1 Tax=Singulisphaera acidiphila (strain ATCC BAA-1392 / DSM 18658 / VKM B-2454 / MOB10) TaxID=886293 RepID=L0DK33_SINAD|nr:hypothetical protein [Singulisphaera acidiphila]AGA29749.1 hypothetical protein Sinac_5616 [Singulisphaera acidiphila DSM 18658]
MSDPSTVPMAATNNPPADPPSSMERKIHDHTEGIQLDVGGEEGVDRRLAEIEMEGEEVAAGWKPAPHQPLSPEVRFLHISRTIHQLITDRNRSVGIFLAVASLSFAASTALLNARPDVVPIIPLKTLQYWCLPVTFGTLAVIGVFMGLILVRTRIGLIYEVSKMNALLGLPSERVKRVNPFSIFFLMYLMVCLCGAAAGGLAVGMLMVNRVQVATPPTAEGELAAIGDPAATQSRAPLLAGAAVGVVYTAAFLAIYFSMVLNATSEEKLVKARS